MRDAEAARAVRNALTTLIARGDLSRREAERLFEILIDGQLSETVKAALLVALATKGETVAEVSGAAVVMRSRVLEISTDVENLVDTCGTGGDGAGTFNISTAAALVAAAAGIPVAKHGNRSVSSRCGSADVLEALGVEVQTDPAGAASALSEIGIAFLYAPDLHPAMRQVATVRKDLGVRTIFNLLGPLTNPARARRQVIGVFEERMVELVGQALLELGCDHALVVRGRDGLDEMTTTNETLVAEIRDGGLETYVVMPEELGLRRADPQHLLGGGPGQNAAILQRVLDGEMGPVGDITVLNAGAAIYVGGASRSLEEGVELAREVQRSGAGAEKLEELRKFTTRASAQ